MPVTPTAPTEPAASSRRDNRSIAVVWIVRVAWMAVAVVGGGAFGAALTGHGRDVQVATTVLLWIVWAIVALASLVPSTIGLTIVRTVSPASVVAACVAALAGSTALDSVAAIALTLLAAVFSFSAEFGEVFAQGSAYGHEQRFVLRPPANYLIPAVVSWAILCAAAISGPLLLAAGATWLGGPITIMAGVLGWFFGRRFHRLSRRWLVLVPAGIVVHDHTVLGETAMFQTAQLANIALALADTEAADLTGPAGGMVVEIQLRDAPTVVLAGTRSKPGGTALHVRSVLVAPTRPGRLLVAAAAQGWPVG